jgi:SMC interacting uncharacterized protein involved in chromosome segregation
MKGEQELESLTDQIIQKRRETTNMMKSLATESVEAESNLVQHLRQQLDTPLDPPVTQKIEIDEDIEPTYTDAIELLSNLETHVPKLATDYERLLAMKDTHPPQ